MKKVDVLLSTYNGEKYLKEQIDSIFKQENVEVRVVIRDDGSTDSTLDIVQQYIDMNYPILLIKGENVGVIKSFLCLASIDSSADYYAFCDQDDVWKPEKLSIAVTNLNDKKGPSLYLSDTTAVDEKLNYIDLQILCDEQKHTYCLEEVLLSNNATGCTMVFNTELKELLNRYSPQKIIMHDHWIYALCIALDGYVYFDRDSYIKYRQHGNNSVGSKVSFANKIKYSSLKRGKNARSAIAMQLLQNYTQELSPNNRFLLEKVSNYNSTIKSKIFAYNLLKKYVVGKKRRVFLLIQMLMNLY